MEVVPLKLVQPGVEAEVCQICGEQSQVRRLQEMGICQGCKLKVVCQGSPCIIKVAGSRICFRENELTNILVRVGSVA